MNDAYNATDLGLTIKARRQELGWNQTELAQWLGVSRPTVVSLEQGGPVSVEVAMRALSVLGLKAVLTPKGGTDADTNA